mmetsp:Transcript_10890/g.39995  ORF Transcript_10890/g.39995 Transcript_10890/m.39995 type:complete len:383 (+) Transcript_10890:82-1230(+)
MFGLLKSSVIAALLAAAEARTTWRDLQQQREGYTYEMYLTEFNKLDDPSRQQGSDSYSEHKTIFDNALKEILAHNDDPAKNWKMGVNKFTDMFAEEFAMFKGKKPDTHATGEHFATSVRPPKKHSEARKLGHSKAPVPDSIDWRDEGVCTPVKDQGGCGSCWAFSATAVLESQTAIATGRLMTMAPQEFVSCAPNPQHCGGTGGCDGSTQELAFSYAMTAGMVLESDYPYTQQTGTCDRSKLAHPVANVTSFVKLPTNDYDALLEAVGTIGPIAISVDASFAAYEEGVFDGTCGYIIDHAVVAVGYGTENGMDYWLVRNSWGAAWGDEGYIKIIREGPDGECGTDTNPSAGDGCDGGPSSIEVCGKCGMLSDSSYPTGAYLM